MLAQFAERPAHAQVQVNCLVKFPRAGEIGDISLQQGVDGADMSPIITRLGTQVEIVVIAFRRQTANVIYGIEALHTCARGQVPAFQQAVNDGVVPAAPHQKQHQGQICAYLHVSFSFLCRQI